MIFKNRIFEFGQTNWPREIHVMQGDTVRISGQSDQNGVEMALAIIGGFGAASTERVWKLNWIAKSDREFYVLSLRRRIAVRPEEKLAEMRVYVHETPPVTLRIIEETDFITRRCELQCPIKETIQSVDFEVDGNPLPNERVEEGKCNLFLNGLTSGTLSVAGRVNFVGNRGSVAITPQPVMLTEIVRLKITPPTKEINLTQDTGLKAIEIQAETLVELPSTAEITVLLNQKAQVVSSGKNIVVVSVEGLEEGEYSVQAIVKLSGRNRPAPPSTFVIRRDMDTEVQRVLAVAREVSLDACISYVSQLSTTQDPTTILKSALQALEIVKKSSQRNNDLLIPNYLPLKKATILREIQANRREILTTSRDFLEEEVSFWSFLEKDTEIPKGKIQVLIKARNLPVSKSEVVTKNLRTRIGQDGELISSVSKS